MKVIGEVMVIGCIYEEFLLKVICLFEYGVYYLGLLNGESYELDYIKECIGY